MHKVFIVDDEPFILEGLASLVDWEDYGLVLSGRASDGLEAFEILRHAEVDILITDIMMRDMNGLELIERLKPLYPRMKFIVLSGYNEFDYVKQGMQLGIENYLLKPVNIQELTETIERTVRTIEQADQQQVWQADQLDILRDNIMNRWAAGKIAPAELKGRLELLDIPFHFPFYAAASVKPTAEGETEERPGRYTEQQLVDRVYRLCRQREKMNSRFVCFTDNEGDIVLLFAGNNHDAVRTAALAELTAIRNEVRSGLGLRLLMTFGSLESGFTGVPESCRHAKRLQEYFLTMPEEQVIVYDEISNLSADSGESPVDLMEYEQLLLGRNKAAVREYIEKLFAGLQESHPCDPAIIHNYAIELIMCTKQIIKEHKLSPEVAESGYKQLFTTLFKAQTLGQLVTHVLFIAEAAIDYLSVQDDDFSPVVKQVLYYIRTRYAEQLSLKTLSQSLRIHPFYLGQLFQKETGVNFTDYLSTHRIRTAQQLLRTTSLKTSDISRSVGYLEPGYFYRQFRKYTGVSPTEYRSGRIAARS